MSRRAAWALGATVLTVFAELVLWVAGYRGHWPVGFAAAMGVLGALALALGSKALGQGALQEPDPGDAGDPGGARP